MVDDGVDARGEPRPRAALQRAVRRALPAEGRRRARALPRPHRLRARSRATTTRPGLVDGVRRARGGGALALARGRARARPRRLQRAQPSASASSRRAIPYGEQCLETARLVAERAGLAGRSLVVGVPVRGPHARAVGGARHRRAPRGRWRPQGVRDVVSVPVGFVSDHVEILFDIDHRAAAGRRGPRHAARAAARAERRPGLHRGARRARARARGAVAGRSAGGVRVVVVGGGIAGLAAARRLELVAPAADDRAGRERQRARRQAPDRAGRRVRDRGGAGQLPVAEGARRRARRGARPRRRAHRAAGPSTTARSFAAATTCTRSPRA